jgi:hypothetical protein
MAKVPPQYARNFRNDMYLTSEAFRLMKKQAVGGFTADDWTVLDNYGELPGPDVFLRRPLHVVRKAAA